MSTFESEVGTTAGELAVAGDRRIPRSSVASWVTYDLANTIFSMGIVSVLFPNFVRGMVGKETGDIYVGNITAVSMAIIFFVSPLLGALTDRARRRIPFLITSTLTCVALTAFMGHGGLVATVILFVLANVAYQAGLQFYDALLPEVSTEENRGRIGGLGVAIGYLGSYIALGVGFLLIHSNMRFTVTAVMFLLFALPAFFFVKERGNPDPRPFQPGAIIDATKQTLRTLKNSDEFPGLLRFLIGRAFYTDSINTVITMMFIFTQSVAETTMGLTEKQSEPYAYRVMFIAVTFAILGGYAWGVLSDRIGPKRTLDLVLISWMCIFGAAAAVAFFGLPILALYLVACAAGASLGGVWAADRPLMLRLTPPDRIGEFYGLYGMVGRFSAITGPFLWGMVLLLSTRNGLSVVQGQGIALLTLLAMIVVSFWILRSVSDTPRNWPVRA